ncbi:ATP-binding protein [Streptomyces sp. NPDC046712]|uniref:ATP-binding protein n=1 Tax=Streptomyces sp. NPDC046712 TaxID=3154802 RepID=UPI003401F9D7
MYRWTDHTLNPTGEARAVLRRVLKDLGLAGDVISDGVLAVSELVANAHEHARGPTRHTFARPPAGTSAKFMTGILCSPRVSTSEPHRPRAPNRPMGRAGCSWSGDGACAS